MSDLRERESNGFLRPQPPIDRERLREIWLPYHSKESLLSFSEAEIQVALSQHERTVNAHFRRLQQAKDPTVAIGYPEVHPAALARAEEIMQLTAEYSPDGIRPIDFFYASLCYRVSIGPDPEIKGGSKGIMDGIYPTNNVEVTHFPLPRDKQAFNGMKMSLWQNGQRIIDHAMHTPNDDFPVEYCVGLAASSIGYYLDTPLVTLHGDSFVTMRYLHDPNNPDHIEHLRTICVYNNALPFDQYRFYEKDGQLGVIWSVARPLMRAPYNITYRSKKPKRGESEKEQREPPPIPPGTLTYPLRILSRHGHPMKVGVQMGTHDYRPDLDEDEVAFDFLNNLNGNGKSQKVFIGARAGETISNERIRQTALELTTKQREVLYRLLIGSRAHGMKNTFAAGYMAYQYIKQHPEMESVFGSIVERNFNQLKIDFPVLLNQIEAGELQIQSREEFDICSYIASLSERYGEKFRIAIDVSEIGDKVARVQGLRIASAVWFETVIENAAKYSGSLTPAVRVHYQENEEEPKHGIVCSNIAKVPALTYEEIIQNVAELNDREIEYVNSSSRDQGGTGQGLTISRRAHDALYLDPGKPGEWDPEERSPFCYFSVEEVSREVDGDGQELVTFVFSSHVVYKSAVPS